MNRNKVGFLIYFVLGLLSILITIIFGRSLYSQSEVWIIILLFPAFILFGCSISSLISLNKQDRLIRFSFLSLTILFWLCIIYFYNDIRPFFNLTKLLWIKQDIIAAGPRIGMDFFDGVYVPIKEFIHHSPQWTYTGYAPITTLVFLPLGFIKEKYAYLLISLSLMTLNFFSLVIASLVHSSIFSDEKSHNREFDLAIWAFVLPGMVFYTFTSYSFSFSIERGNFDIYSGFLAILGLFLLIKYPDKIWLQTICISLSAQFKLYPAILFFLLLWKHGKKSILPIIVTNLVLLFILGPKPALDFISGMIAYINNTPFISLKNNSGLSFGTQLFDFVLSPARVGINPDILTAIFTWFPGLLFLGVLASQWKKGFSSIGAFWLFIIAYIPMFTIPSTSHDYKLVLLSVPILLILARLINCYIVTGSMDYFIKTSILLCLIFLLHRSFLFTPIFLLQNKYPILFAFQIFTIWLMFTDPAMHNFIPMRSGEQILSGGNEGVEDKQI